MDFWVPLHSFTDIHHRHTSVEQRLTDPSKPLPHTSTTREYKCHRAYVNIEVTNPNDPLICSRWHHSYITWNSGRVCYVAEPMVAWHVQLPMDQRMKIKSYLNIRKVRNDKPTIASLEKGTMEVSTLTEMEIFQFILSCPATTT
jgi:hypothetical protein